MQRDQKASPSQDIQRDSEALESNANRVELKQLFQTAVKAYQDTNVAPNITKVARPHAVPQQKVPEQSESQHVNLLAKIEEISMIVSCLDPKPRRKGRRPNNGGDDNNIQITQTSLIALLQQYHNCLIDAIRTIEIGNLSRIDKFQKDLEYMLAARDKAVCDWQEETAQVKIMQAQLDSQTKATKDAEAQVRLYEETLKWISGSNGVAGNMSGGNSFLELPNLLYENLELKSQLQNYSIRIHQQDAQIANLWHWYQECDKRLQTETDQYHELGVGLELGQAPLDAPNDSTPATGPPKPVEVTLPVIRDEWNSIREKMHRA